MKKFSPALFGFALFCFFLPFVSVSCQQQKVASFTGIQMITGTSVEQPQMFGPPRLEKVDAEPLAILAFLSGLGGLGLSFLKGRGSPIAAAVVAVVGAIGLLLLKSKLENEILRQSSGFVHPEYEIGFWLVVISYFAAAALNVSILFSQEKVGQEARHDTLAP